VSAGEAVKLLLSLKLRRTRRRVMPRYRLANTPPEKRKFLRKSQLWSEDFTAKLFCNVEFWIERLPKLIGSSEILRKGSRMAWQGDRLTISSG
jgi:hypothetical protein